MEQKFRESLERILPGGLKHRYVIAVSGGLDSMVLAELMLRIVPANQLVIAHFDHQTRGLESKTDARFVQRFAQEKKITFELGNRRGEKSSEASLRKERYDFLRSVRRTHNCDYVLLAHHLQDQVETFLMRLLRGTGLDGLAVMEPRRGFWVRPLLSFSKETLEKEAERRGIQFRLDSSNMTSQYFRNRIRLTLMPHLEELAGQYGGKEKWLERLEPLFEEIRSTRKELNRSVKKKLMRSLTETPFWIRMPRESLDGFSSQERSRALRFIVSRLGTETLSMAEFKRLDEALLRNQKNISCPGIAVKNSCEYLYFQKNEVKPPDPKFRQSEENGQIVCELLGLSIESDYPEEVTEWRFYKPGDRFRGKKLKEYFLKKRIPRPERSLVPVLANKNSSELIWVFPEKDSKIRLKQMGFPFAVI